MLDKATSLPVPVRKGVAPVVGLIIGGIGVALDGVAGTVMSSFGFSEMAGSAGLSITKKIAGIPG